MEALAANGLFLAKSSPAKLWFQSPQESAVTAIICLLLADFRPILFSDVSVYLFFIYFIILFYFFLICLFVCKR